jgi:hypothetical protein
MTTLTALGADTLCLSEYVAHIAKTRTSKDATIIHCCSVKCVSWCLASSSHTGVPEVSPAPFTAHETSKLFSSNLRYSPRFLGFLLYFPRFLEHMVVSRTEAARFWQPDQASDKTWLKKLGEKVKTRQSRISRLGGYAGGLCGGLSRRVRSVGI